MEDLTWKQFKRMVDAEIAKKGLTEDIRIDYFDCSHPDRRTFEENRQGVIYVDESGLTVHC